MRTLSALLLTALVCLCCGCRVEQVDETTQGAATPEAPPAEKPEPQPPPEPTPEAVEPDEPAGPTRPEPAEYACLRAIEAITIDGNLDDLAWEEANEIADFYLPATFETPAGETATRLLWDDEWLYWSVEAADRDLFALRSQRDDLLCRDDVFELFLKPREAERSYYEIEINPRNATFDLFFGSRGSGGADRWKGWDPELKSAVKLDGTLNGYRDEDGGWSMEMAIPLEALHVKPAADEVWKFAVCRYDYSVYLEGVELSSCAPLTRPSFHRYEEYLELRFMGDGGDEGDE